MCEGFETGREVVRESNFKVHLVMDFDEKHNPLQLNVNTLTE